MFGITNKQIVYFIHTNNKEMINKMDDYRGFEPYPDEDTEILMMMLNNKKSNLQTLNELLRGTIRLIIKIDKDKATPDDLYIFGRLIGYDSQYFKEVAQE